jgi:hypothetical protein
MNIFKSVFNGISSAAHSTVAWLEKELVAFTKAAPKLEQIVDAGLAYIGPVLQLALTATGEGDAAKIVGDVIHEAQADLTAASALVTDFGPTPTAASVFASVADHLSTLLTDGHVKNPQSVAAVTKAVTEVGLLGSAIEAAVKALESASSTPASA